VVKISVKTSSLFHDFINTRDKVRQTVQQGFHEVGKKFLTKVHAFVDKPCCETTFILLFSLILKL